MVKESRSGIQKAPIFRETFTDEATTRVLSGTPTAVTYSNGSASCIEASSSRIVYTLPLNGTYSVRIRLKSHTPNTSAVGLFIDFRDISGTGFIASAITTGSLAVSSGTGYINGISSTTIDSNLKEIIVTGISIISPSATLNSRSIPSAFKTADYELLEIYQGTLTAQEVLSIYNNSRYVAPRLTEILNVHGKNGMISNRYGTALVNTAVTPVRQGNVFGMDFNGSTSKLDCGAYNNLLGDKTFVFWVKQNRVIPGVASRLIDCSNLLIYMTDIVVFTPDGGATNASTSSVIKSGNIIMVTVTRSSTGIVNFYINNLLSGAANRPTITPIAASGNIIIGNNAGSTRPFHGVIYSATIIEGILSANDISQLYSSERKIYNV